MHAYVHADTLLEGNMLVAEVCMLLINWGKIGVLLWETEDNPHEMHQKKISVAAHLKGKIHRR